MQRNRLFFPKNISKTLENIKNIKFTLREREIIACISAGRSSKKIASLLSIAQRTVEKHIHNIMSKLNCNSQEHIRDFIEKSDKYENIKNHYLNLLTQDIFLKKLDYIAALNKNGPQCYISYCNLEEAQKELILKVESHLKRSRIKVSREEREPYKSFNQFMKEIKSRSMDYGIYIPSETLGSEEKLEKFNKKTEKKEEEEKLEDRQDMKDPIDFLFIDLKNIKNDEKDFNQINDGNFQESYYLAIFEILKQMLPEINLNEVISEFCEECKEIDLTSNSKKNLSMTSEKISKGFFKKNYWWVIGLCLIVFGSSGTFFIKMLEISSKSQFIRSDLSIPTENNFLERSGLIKKIEERLNGNTGIKTVVLVGIGGSGKTVLARSYAGSQRSSVVYEINAENRYSLMRSFKQLAENIAQNGTKDEKEEFAFVQKIQDVKEEERRVLSFVKKQLKKTSGWVLIYDNVENLLEIKDYFPQDSKLWGNGKIIITTLNHNINLDPDRIILIEKLTPDEALMLFSKILFNLDPSKLKPNEKEEALIFLKNIPPFPLDIFLSAHYLESTHISYEKYLEHLNQQDKDFDSFQEKILNEMSDYKNTRFNIIRISLEKLVQTNKEFGDLFLFMCLLNSQNIPKDLLELYKKDTLVDEFIYNLQKYSLITSESSSSCYGHPLFSIHRSIQEMSLNFLKNLLKLEKKSPQLEKIAGSLEKYMHEVGTKEDVRMKLAIEHGEFFLNHKNLLSDLIKANISIELGRIYGFSGKFEKSEEKFEESLQIYERDLKNNYLKVGECLLRLGILHEDLGDYSLSKDFLEKSYSIYKQYEKKNQGKNDVEKGINYFETGWVLMALGNTYRSLGNYKAAKSCFEQGLKMHENYYVKNFQTPMVRIRYARILKSLGYNTKAREIIEKNVSLALNEYKEYYGMMAPIWKYLASVYLNLYNDTLDADLLKKAENLLEKSLNESKNLYGEDHAGTASVWRYLGNVYKHQAHYKKSEEYLNKSLEIYKKKFEENHPKTAKILRDLGQVYLLNNELIKSEEFIKKSLSIFNNNKHPEAYTCLETLGEIYRRKAVQALQKKEGSLFQVYKRKSIDYLEDALTILQNYFPKDSPHFSRLQKKLNSIKNL